MKKLMSRIYFILGAWPSIPIFWAGFLGPGISLQRAAFRSLLYALIYLFAAYRRNRQTKIDITLTLYWAVGFMLTFIDGSIGEMVLIQQSTTVLYALFFAMALFPVLLGAEPFTMAFARRRTPEIYWKTELFQTINRKMAMVWAALFAAAALSSLLPGTWIRYVLPVLLLLGIGIPLNKKFPEYYSKKKGLGNILESSGRQPATEEQPHAFQEIPQVQTADKDEKTNLSRGERVRGLEPIKKPLIIFGSPRGERGFTYKALQRFLDGMRSEGLEPETIFLHKQKIRPCTGCFSCWTKTPGVCMHKDDMAGLLEKVEQADLIVYAQPLYTFSVPGITKNFLDRLLPRLQPYLIEDSNGSTTHPRRWQGNENQRMVIFSVCGFPEKGHFDPMLQMFYMLSHHSGVPIVGELLRPASESMRFSERIGESYNRVMDGLFAAGEQLASQGYVHRETEEIVAQQLLPDVRGFRVIANQLWETSIHYEAAKKKGEQLPGFEEYLQNDPGMLFGGMASSYNPARAGDFEGTYQFFLNDKENGEYYIEIKDKQCSMHLGKAKKPDITIHTPWDVWHAISNGALSGQEALMKGLYRVEGEMAMLLRMQEIFSS